MCLAVIRVFKRILVCINAAGGSTMKAIKKIVAKYNDINLIFRIFIGM